MKERNKSAKLDTAIEVLKESGAYGLILPSHIYQSNEAHASQLLGILKSHQEALIKSRKSDLVEVNPLKKDGIALIPQIESPRDWFLLLALRFTPDNVLFDVRRMEKRGHRSESVTMRPGELLAIAQENHEIPNLSYNIAL